jgi:predicted O-methyltransferase YrrM
VPKVHGREPAKAESDECNNSAHAARGAVAARDMEIVREISGRIRRLVKKPVSIETRLAPLPTSYRSTLLSMYSAEPQLGYNGQRHELRPDTRISAEQGMWLHELALGIRPQQTLEIGLAYGFSTLYILAALEKQGRGHHTAIDPLQQTLWHGIGERLSLETPFRFIPKYSTDAMVELSRQGEKFELIFIDGDHKFDSAFVDFQLSADLCPVGGCIVFDDVCLKAIKKVVGFITANRPDFQRVKTKLSNVAVFARIDRDRRDWSHFRDF